MAKTLKEYINNQPKDSINELKAKLSLHLNKSLDTLQTYITGKSAVPQDVREDINRYFRAKDAKFTDIDFTRAHEEYLKRNLKKSKANRLSTHA